MVAGNLEILYGDIHNHNALGYGLGSLERSIDIATEHLDFFAFTGHASWHDMEPMEGQRENHWINGFAKLKSNWRHVQNLIADANDKNGFSAFLGYEWHSSEFGDQCVVFPQDHRPLHLPDSVANLREFCISENALMIPHHLAYPQGHRGVNWSVFDSRCTPVVEIYSEHGNSENDRGPLTFFNHSLGGRETGNTIQSALARGLQFGFVASSDNHRGFPGAYGEGLMSVHSRGRDRASILEAIYARRTVALTGDRIAVEMLVDGIPFGTSITAGSIISVDYEVTGRDEIDVVELIQDGQVVHRNYPLLDQSLKTATEGVFQIRLEWGWGPWGDLDLARTTDWEFTVAIDEGQIHAVYPCLQSGPYDENRRHRIKQTSERQIDVTSYTSRTGAYRMNPNQSLVMEMSCPPSAGVTVALMKPLKQNSITTVADLYTSSLNEFVGPFPQEAYQWHRLLPRGASHVRGQVNLPLSKNDSSIYLRVRQCNGQMAWASPVYMNYR